MNGQGIPAKAMTAMQRINFLVVMFPLFDLYLARGF
jgi:hypothetical protein